MHERSAETLYNEGRLAFDGGQFRKAIYLLQESLVSCPHYKAFELLGASYRALAQPEEAYSALEQAFAMNPKSNKTACLLAESLIDSGEFSRAAQIASAVLVRSPTYGPAKRVLESLPAADVCDRRDRG